MPLRDHFRPPLSDRRSWDELHGGWPMMIVAELNRKLPERYVAVPQVHLGSSFEVDVATYDQDGTDPSAAGATDGGGVATAIWAPPRPTLTVATDLPDVDEYEVRVYDVTRGRRLVAAVELVNPSNKDRPETRQAFVAKCAALLQQRVSVTIVDVVTTREFNLYAELLAFLGRTDMSLATPPTNIYAVACRGTIPRQRWLFEAWHCPLTMGQPLPTLPLWLAHDFVVSLDLEASYEETCRALRIA